MHVLPHCRYYITLFFFGFFWLAGVTRGTSVCSAHDRAFNTCWTVSSRCCGHIIVSHTFCVPLRKHLSALSEKMLVFLQSLPWVIEKGENTGDEISSALPATYFFLLVRAHFHAYRSPLFSIYLYIYHVYLFSSLCNIFRAKSLSVHIEDKPFDTYSLSFWEQCITLRLLRLMPIEINSEFYSMAKIFLLWLACLSKFSIINIMVTFPIYIGQNCGFFFPFFTGGGY